MQLILIHAFAICIVRAMETPVPASLLQPRNFNPHPYQDDERFIIVPGYPQDDFRRLNLEQKFQEFSRKTQRSVSQLVRLSGFQEYLFAVPGQFNFQPTQTINCSSSSNNSNKANQYHISSIINL